MKVKSVIRVLAILGIIGIALGAILPAFQY